MKKPFNYSGRVGLQAQKRRMCFFVEEGSQQTLGDPLLKKLDTRIR